MISRRNTIRGFLFAAIFAIAGVIADPDTYQTDQEQLATSAERKYRAERNLTATEQTVFQFVIDAPMAASGELTVTQERDAANYLTGQGPILVAASLVTRDGATLVLAGQGYFGDAHLVQVHTSEGGAHVGPRAFASDGSIWNRQEFHIGEGRSVLVVVVTGGTGSLEVAIDLPPEQVDGPWIRELATLWTFGDISDVGVNIEAGLLGPSAYSGSRMMALDSGDVIMWLGDSDSDVAGIITGGFTCQVRATDCPPVAWFREATEVELATEGSAGASDPNWYALIRAPTYADEFLS